MTDPRDGNLTVEDDRAAIDVLCLVADDLRSRLYLSAVSQMFSEANFDEAMGKGWHNQEQVPDALRQNIIETQILAPFYAAIPRNGPRCSLPPLRNSEPPWP